MKCFATSYLTIALLFAVASVANAAPTEWFSIDFTGMFSVPDAAGTVQIGPDNALGLGDDETGAFAQITSYVASPGLPILAFDDLGMYGLAMVATVDTFDQVTRTVTHSGSLYLYAPGYGFDELGQQLEQGTFTATAVYDSDWATATINGLVQLHSGAMQPAGWPAAVDWSAGGPAYLTGTFYNDDTRVFIGTIQSVPEPGTIALAGLAGVAGLAIVRRRRGK